ncbi:CD209 antigen-like protein E isoform X2 [Betta splendens]|uniref:CD209 antigen-like protein E isoform X2 n=1 Tax=Betta splendens TaxID=158456 RepID=A0A6P7LPS5_BETSP|nr:CD209 antigen-like protein E isoform X2 [Betta splendens]
MDRVAFIRNAPELFSNIRGNIHSCCKTSGQGAKAKAGSLLDFHSAALQLINKMEYLRGNHSEVMETVEEAKKALETAISNHTQMKTHIEQQKTVNDAYQKQVEALQTEKSRLQSNISALEGSCGKCLPGWTLFNSSCYFFSYLESATVKKNWADSRADCVGRGADLVVIDSQEEQKFASNSINKMKTSTSVWENGFWTGLTDTEAEGAWVWINNVTEVEQRYWMDGEPNNYGGGEDCGVIIYSRSNPWKTRYDGHCHTPLHWICETTSR